MQVSVWAVVNGSGRIVKVSSRSFEMERQQRVLTATKPAPGPYRVVELTGEVERVEAAKR